MTRPVRSWVTSVASTQDRASRPAGRSHGHQRVARCGSAAEWAPRWRRSPTRGPPQPGAWATLRRGLALSPEFRDGLPVTLLLALAATVGRVLVPIAVQQTIDRGLIGPDGPDLTRVREAVLLAAFATVLTAIAAYLMNVRLFRTTESGLATLRVRAFRHVHDLSVLHPEHRAPRLAGLAGHQRRRPDLQFLQWGGLLVVVSVGQIAGRHRA